MLINKAPVFVANRNNINYQVQLYKMLFLSLLFLFPTLTLAFTHGWDCVACPSNSMLIAQFGTHREDFNFSLDNDWWINEIADNYYGVMLGNFYARVYNGTGEDSKVTVARKLKERNPNFKAMFYQPVDRFGDTPWITDYVAQHPEMWLYDDYGNMVGTRPQADHTVVEAQDYIANLTIANFPSRAEAKAIISGVLVDGVDWNPAKFPNISKARLEKMFDGMMVTMEKMQGLISDLTSTDSHSPGPGEVMGNPLLNYGVIGANTSDSKGADWNLTLCHYDGGFDEMFGAFATLAPADSDPAIANGSGIAQWDIKKMQVSFHISLY